MANKHLHRAFCNHMVLGVLLAGLGNSACKSYDAPAPEATTKPKPLAKPPAPQEPLSPAALTALVARLRAEADALDEQYAKPAFEQNEDSDDIPGDCPRPDASARKRADAAIRAWLPASSIGKKFFFARSPELKDRFYQLRHESVETPFHLRFGCASEAGMWVGARVVYERNDDQQNLAEANTLLWVTAEGGVRMWRGSAGVLRQDDDEAAMRSQNALPQAQFLDKGEPVLVVQLLESRQQCHLGEALGSWAVFRGTDVAFYSPNPDSWLQPVALCCSEAGFFGTHVFRQGACIGIRLAKEAYVHVAGVSSCAESDSAARSAAWRQSDFLTDSAERLQRLLKEDHRESMSPHDLTLAQRLVRADLSQIDAFARTHSDTPRPREAVLPKGPLLSDETGDRFRELASFAQAAEPLSQQNARVESMWFTRPPAHVDEAELERYRVVLAAVAPRADLTDAHPTWRLSSLSAPRPFTPRPQYAVRFSTWNDTSAKKSAAYIATIERAEPSGPKLVGWIHSDRGQLTQTTLPGGDVVVLAQSWSASERGFRSTLYTLRYDRAHTAELPFVPWEANRRIPQLVHTPDGARVKTETDWLAWNSQARTWASKREPNSAAWLKTQSLVARARKRMTVGQATAAFALLDEAFQIRDASKTSGKFKVSPQWPSDVDVVSDAWDHALADMSDTLGLSL